MRIGIRAHEGAMGGRVPLALALAGALVPILGCAAGDASNVTSPSAPPTPYVLFAPLNLTATYLMDLQGRLVHQWPSSYNPALSVYLLPNGLLLRPEGLGTNAFPAGGGNGGRVAEYDWDGNLVWSFDYASTSYQQHHDVRWMPNGHVLMVAWEKRSGAEAIAAGRDRRSIPANGEVWVDHVVEVDPATSQIVWIWRLWDHLLPPGADPADHPELVDPNFNANASTSDWTHVNAIDYNATLDQVMVSSRNLSEIWVIDHSTTAGEAAGHTGGRYGRGGDLLYRWGNPASHGWPGPQQLFGQHNSHWIEDGLPGAGEILLFNNGDRDLRPYSTAVQIAPPLQADGRYTFDPQSGFGPGGPSWQYVASPPESLFAAFISSAQRLPSGNTLLCDGPGGRFFEVTPAGDTVWSYLITDTSGKTGISAFRATRYEGSYSGLRGRTLTPQGVLQVPVAPTSRGANSAF